MAEPDTNKVKPLGEKEPLVLVVDDEPAICDALERILMVAGYSVVIASEGKTALGIVADLKPDLLILDIKMPGMDGRELCKKAREICDCRVIYFSAISDLYKPEKSRELIAEADGVISKPANRKQILFAIKSALDKARR